MANAHTKDLTKSNRGQPTVMTEKVLDKLRTAFLIGASDREACLYADISMQTLYNHQSRHPEYVEQKAMWKQTPILKARKTLADNLDKPEHAKWYLERKVKDEFTPRTETVEEVRVLLDFNENNKIQRTDELSAKTGASIPDVIEPTV